VQSVQSRNSKTVSKSHITNLIATLEPALLYRGCLITVIKFEYCYRELQEKIKQQRLKTQSTQKLVIHSSNEPTDTQTHTYIYTRTQH